jgi:hypothetical protein
MRAPLTQSAQEVAEALGITSERTALDGSPWCPPRDADLVRRWVTDRGRELGGGIRRAVRLARLLAAAEGNYLQFLHVRIPTLRARNFKFALQAAAAAGRLPRAMATLAASGVHFHEALLAPPNATGFDIDFAQMPRLAALLDVLHNALGFATVEDLLKPVLARGAPPVHADEVARSLHASFNGWLSERLESPHYIRQAQKMRAFLTSRGPVGPDAIDDEAILAFWVSVAAMPGDSETEGFRLYRSSARAMLRYRRALRDAESYRQIGMPLNLDDHLRRQPEGDNAAVAVEAWQSPLRVLGTHPANGVKWLTKRERLRLLNYLGGPHPDREEPEDEPPEAAEQGAETGLVDAERFDLRFVRTLLRADVFGPVQSNLVAALRRRLAPTAAIGQALSQAGDAAYEACATSYAEVGEQLRLECLAALLPLLQAGAPQALHLVFYLGGREAFADLVGDSRRDRALDDEADDEQDGGQETAAGRDIGAWVAALERAAATGAADAPVGPVQTLLAQSNAALRKVARVGFRREDRGDAAIVAALATGATAVIDILRELDRLLPPLQEAGPRDALIADRQRFEAAFRRIYAAGGAGDASDAQRGPDPSRPP